MFPESTFTITVPCPRPAGMFPESTFTITVPCPRPVGMFPEATFTITVPCPRPVGMFSGKPPTVDIPHRKRCKRYDVDGDAHHLTFSCFQRIPLFSRDRTCRWMLQALELGRANGEYDLWAYVIMPEHVHVVVWPHPGVRVKHVLTTLKQSVSKRAIVWLRENAPQFLIRLEDVQPNGKRTHRFWQRGGGYDRNLRTVADIHEKIEYVHANPVRRGLADSPGAWRWSSCHAWLSGKDEPIAIDRGSVPSLEE
jgi:putative transposase